jgi:uncharacterized protein
MPLQLTEHTDAQAFHDAVIAHLLRSEAECCAQIGLIRRMASDGYSPVSVDELDRPLLLTVQDGHEVDLVALQTLKTKMLITRGSAQGMELLARWLVSSGWTGNSLIGVCPSIKTLVDRYAELSGRSPRLEVRLRVFDLQTVSWPNRAPGSIRLCESADRHVLARFIAGFEADIGETSEEDPLARADRLIGDRRIFFWIDGEPVAMAAWAGRTPNGNRVNHVYTRPDARARGYASNLVAHLSQYLLDQGRRFCFLFTDLANPTSNGIYQKLGYRPVSDCERWEFDGYGGAIQNGS